MEIPEELGEEIKNTLIDYCLRTDFWGKGDHFADLFAQCHVSVEVTTELVHWGDSDRYYPEDEFGPIVIEAPPELHAWLGEHHERGDIIREIVEATIIEYGKPRIEFRLRRVRKPQGNNQGVVAGRCPYFDDFGLGYRSKSELAIANALRKEKVLFFPLPAAVYGSFKLEPDFLICHEGKWGTLEVLGKPYHPDASRELERIRNFNKWGIKHVFSVDSDRCLKDPEGVVREFLGWLARMYLTPG